jgi:type VI protein secretion system component Hcp
MGVGRVLSNHVVRRRGDNQGFSDHVTKKRSAEQIFSDHGKSKVAMKKISFTTWIDREVV